MGAPTSVSTGLTNGELLAIIVCAAILGFCLLCVISVKFAEDIFSTTKDVKRAKKARGTLCMP